MKTYYNDFDVGAGRWIRGLVRHRWIPAGVVDMRDIRDVQTQDTAPISHFFAGVAGWPLALRLAGLSHLECWTGSTPCQPFSIAGQRGGFGDERDLWPVWLRLIRESRPPVLFGEQAASELGRAWFARLLADLEALGYACVCADLCAAGVGAPHKRQRLFFGAVHVEHGVRAVRRALVDRVVHSPDAGPDVKDPAEAGGLRPIRSLRFPDWGSTVLRCRDRRWRPYEPGLGALAYGVPNPMVVRGYGNAIVPQLGRIMIESTVQAVEDVWKG